MNFTLQGSIKVIRSTKLLITRNIKKFDKSELDTALDILENLELLHDDLYDAIVYEKGD